jgi:hypothetical protein
MAMNKYIILFMLGLVALTACKKPLDEACFEAEPYHFKPTGSSFKDCSAGPYVLWEFSDGTGMEGTTVQHIFSEAGNYSLTQTVYAEDGRTSSSSTLSFYTGYIYIDSIVYDKLLVPGFQDPDGGETADLYVRYNGVRSNETYEDYFPDGSKVVFTFPYGGVYLPTVNSYDLSLFDSNTLFPDLLLANQTYTPYQGEDRFNNPLEENTDSKYEYAIYWHVGPEKP